MDRRATTHAAFLGDLADLLARQPETLVMIRHPYEWSMTASSSRAWA